MSKNCTVWYKGKPIKKDIRKNQLTYFFWTWKGWICQMGLDNIHFPFHLRVAIVDNRHILRWAIGDSLDLLVEFLLNKCISLSITECNHVPYCNFLSSSLYRYIYLPNELIGLDGWDRFRTQCSYDLIWKQWQKGVNNSVLMWH